MTNHKPKIWIISDTHLGARNNSVEWLERMINYFDNFFIPLVKKHYKKGDILIHSGDVFDNRQSLNLLVMNKGLRVFEELSAIFEDGIHIIAGNHDILRKNSNDITSIDVLKYLPNITIHKEPKILEIGEHNILLMPWRKSHQDEVDCILEHAQAHYCFCHANISGMRFDARRLIEHGSDINAYSKLRRVFSGHIHYAQTNGNVTFVGNPYQMTRSDAGNRKGIHCLNLETSETEFYENNYSPKFIRLYLDKCHELTIGQLKEKCKNNFVDVYVKSEYLVKYPINGLINELNDIASKLEVVAYEEEELDINVDYDKSLNIYSLCEKYVEQLSVDDETKKKLNSKLFSLYNKTITDRI